MPDISQLGYTAEEFAHAMRDINDAMPSANDVAFPHIPIMPEEVVMFMLYAPNELVREWADAARRLGEPIYPLEGND